MHPYTAIAVSKDGRDGFMTSHPVQPTRALLCTFIVGAFNPTISVLRRWGDFQKSFRIFTLVVLMVWLVSGAEKVFIGCSFLDQGNVSGCIYTLN